MLLILCCVLFMNSRFSLVTAMSDEQKAMIHKHFEELGKECLKDNVITVDDINKLRSKQVPEGKNAPCFLALNSEEVADGVEGCDRAIMAYKCMRENASKFGLEI